MPSRTQHAPVEDAVRRDYDRWAVAYAERFADIDAQHALDRELFALFAELVRRDGGTRVADLGCGPGHWAGHLAGLGLDVTGVDLSPVFLDLARAAHPDLDFRHGSMAALPLGDGTLDGAVAWFSLIHTPPAQVPVLLDEMVRVLAPGGRVLVGFQTTEVGADDVEPFDHKVTAAYRWPVEALVWQLELAGLEVTARSVREPEEGERHRQGALLARKVSGAAAGTRR